MIRFSCLIFCVFYLTILKVQSQKTNTTPASSTFANTKALYLNLRDLLDPCAAISIGCYYPIKNNTIIDLQVGFINPYSSMFSPYAVKSFYSSDDINNIQLNNYGIKISTEYKFLVKQRLYKKLFHGPQIVYQHELAQGEVNYRRFNSYNQYLDTDWKFHTLGLFYKFGFIFADKSNHLFVEIGFGVGFEYFRDFNSVLSEFPDASLLASRGIDLFTNTPKPGTLPPEPAALFINFGNQDAFAPNLAFSLKMGLSK